MIQFTKINEKQMIACLLLDPALVFEFSENYFLSQTGREVFDLIKNIVIKDLDLNDTTLVKYGSVIDERYDAEFFESIRMSEYSPEQWKNYFGHLKENYARNQLETRVFDKVIELSESSKFSADTVRALGNELLENADMMSGEKQYLTSLPQAFDEYESELNGRKNGSISYSYGDHRLDRISVTGPVVGEMTSIIADTGMGKSTRALNLINMQINRHIPSIYVPTEIKKIPAIDRLLSLRNQVPMSTFYRDETGELNDAAFHYLEVERNKLRKANKFFIADSDTSLSIEGDLSRIAKEARKKMKLGKKDLIHMVIDLTTMLKDFSGKDAKEYEHGVNLLYELARREYLHVTNILQIRRNLTDVRLTHPQQVYKLRPRVSDIKNSGAFGERSRVVLGEFRAHGYYKKFFPEQPELLETPDIMEEQILKNNNGPEGAILKHLHFGGQFRLIPWYDKPTDPLLDDVPPIEEE